MRIFIEKIIVIFLSLFLLLSANLLSQETSVGLEEAIDIARSNYAGLKRDELSVERFRTLSKSGQPHQPAQIFISGEEFNTDGQLGIHSLNVQQNFYLPGASNARKNYYRSQSEVADKQLALTDRTLEWEVKKAYYQLLYIKEDKTLIEENEALYEEFMTIAEQRMKTGETGKIPLLAARTRLGKARLDKEHAKEKHQIALSLFNQWLNSTEPYDAAGELIVSEEDRIDTSRAGNPHMAIFEARKDLAGSMISLQESKLQPQLNTGARLQTVSGDFPFFGYQIGLNIPLFRKAYNTQIDAAKIRLKENQAAIDAKRQMLSRVISDLQYRLDHQGHVVKYLREDLFPLVKEQLEVNHKAYREGEIGYLEYLNSLEEDVELKRKYLEALYEYNLIRAELEYWTGN
ncbi:MAG: TolC family protein [Saprospiraceae bacterium]|nr:TolC family protein [Saprospiraceae bacterium]